MAHPWYLLPMASWMHDVDFFMLSDIKAPTTKEIAADLTRDEIEEKKALPEIEKIEVINLIEAFAYVNFLA